MPLSKDLEGSKAEGYGSKSNSISLKIKTIPVDHLFSFLFACIPVFVLL